MQELVLGISLEITDAVPSILVFGMTLSCSVVLMAGLVVSCFRTFINMIGR